MTPNTGDGVFPSVVFLRSAEGYGRKVGQGLASGSPCYSTCTEFNMTPGVSLACLPLIASCRLWTTFLKLKQGYCGGHFDYFSFYFPVIHVHNVPVDVLCKIEICMITLFINELVSWRKVWPIMEARPKVSLYVSKR